LILLEFIIDGTVGLLAGRIATYLRSRHSARRLLDRATGTLFIALGLRLATDR
jgi:threonine/homoserine/homoserine lactone efflux protein